jgi:hypothetical protein
VLGPSAPATLPATAGCPAHAKSARAGLAVLERMATPQEIATRAIAAGPGAFGPSHPAVFHSLNVLEIVGPEGLCWIVPARLPDSAMARRNRGDQGA